MSAPSRQFAGICVASTVLVPGLLLLGPFGGARGPLGVGAGWSLALLVIVPSWMLLRRVIDTNDQMQFHRTFMGTVMGRFAVAIAAIVAFALLVDEPPLLPFLTTFFLGFTILGALEILLLMRARRRREHA